MLTCFLKRPVMLVGFIVALFMMPAPTLAQTFDSGSDGSDGALNLTTPGTVVFDPTTMGLDADGDGIYQFTTINVASGVTVRLGADVLGSHPVYWLASGDVMIDGVLDLNGEAGHTPQEPHIPAVAGAGGYSGGIGGSATVGATPGSGPGGGKKISSSSSIGTASHARVGNTAGNSNLAELVGEVYGNDFLIPLVGGSGGAGSGYSYPNIYNTNTSGGGAGGGAILIASSTLVQINGQILANAGNNSGYYGGVGSGGAIRIVSNVVGGTGKLSVFGQGSGQHPGRGRIRIEAFDQQYTGALDPGGVAIYATPGILFPPTESTPKLRVVSINNTPVPNKPLGVYTPADMTLDTFDDAILNIEANHIPLGTIVKVGMFSESEGYKEYDSTPLAGSLENSTATATFKIPPGFSRFEVKANWGQ